MTSSTPAGGSTSASCPRRRRSRRSARLGVVGTLVLGGWLVLRGQTDVGTVVATLTGMARIDRPWNNLIKFYRTLGTVMVRYGLLADGLR